jgi:transposase
MKLRLIVKYEILDRYIVVNAGNSHGFIEGAGLIFKSKKKSLDYHSEINAETFEEWLKDKLLPALTEPSIIVLDNASYRSRLEEKKPTCAWRKTHLQTWLQNNNIHFSETDKKDILLKLCRQNYKSPVYVVDRVIHEAGHKPLRLPPYHCIFNPIEMVWSQTKRRYESEVLKNKNQNFGVEDSFRRGLCRTMDTLHRSY